MNVLFYNQLLQKTVSEVTAKIWVLALLAKSLQILVLKKGTKNYKIVVVSHLTFQFCSNTHF